MLIDRSNMGRHFIWFVVFLVGTAVATVWYGGASFSAGRLLGGASAPGFVCGAIGGFIMLFEFALWPRKTLLRIYRIGTTQAWLRAHIWLGFLSIPLITYHTGFRFGGTLSTVLLVLFIVVIASGIWGLVMQNILPKRMLESVPAETIYSQIEYVSAQMSRDAEHLVRSTCGTPEAQEQDGGGSGGEVVTVGAVRVAGRVQGRVFQPVATTGFIPGCDALDSFYREHVVDFLSRGDKSTSALRSVKQAEVMFGDLTNRLPVAAHATVSAIEQICSQRRQFAQQARMQFWLHCWLWLHLPLSFALVVIMLVHVFVAIKFW